MNTFTYTHRNISAKLFAVLTMVSMILSAFPVAFFVANAQAPDDVDVLQSQDSVTICHSLTGKNYSRPPVNVDAIITLPNGHNSHAEYDIIPSFWYDIGDGVKYYEGLNWPDATGIWENDCKDPDADYGSITVTKIVEGGEAKPSDFELYVNDSEVESGVSNDFLSSQTGPGEEYVISEGDNSPENYYLTAIQCIQGDDEPILGDLGKGEVTIYLKKDKHYDCTITNTYREPEPEIASLTIKKVAGGDTTTEFDFTGDLGDFTLVGGSSTTATDLVPGEYTITETVTDGWSLLDITCNDVQMNGSIPSVTLDLEDGDDVTCIFTNRPVDTPPPVPGYCGDGIINQAWEQCELGDDNCTAYCTLDNQCQDLRLIKVTIDEDNPASESFDGTLHLGSLGNIIPNGTWFNFDELGDDSAFEVSSSTDGLAIQRTATDLILSVFGGSNQAPGTDHAHGLIETLGITLGSIDTDPFPGSDPTSFLEIPGLPDGNADEYYKIDNTSVRFEFNTGHAADAGAVKVLQGDEYDCPEQCEPERYVFADNSVDNEQGLTKGGNPVSLSRSNPDDATGDPDWTSGGGTGFYSLGFGGWIEVSFDKYVVNVDGDDLSIHEATNGTYPLEKAMVEVSQDGLDWHALTEEARNDNDEGGDGVTLLDFDETGLDWIKHVRITDTSDSSLHNNDADGFDLDTVDATYVVCDEPESEPVQCTMTISSDDTNTVVEKGGAFAKILSFVHPNWVNSLPIASWIWGDDGPVDPSAEETQTFVKQFGINPAITITSANLSIASDNQFDADLNGSFTLDDDDEDNFTALQNYNVLGDVSLGNNEFSVAVTNLEFNTENPQINPAGLYYELVITGEGAEECGAPYDPEPILGCTDPKAVNYDPKATEDDDSCRYDEPESVCLIGDNLLTNGSFETPVVEYDKLWGSYDSVLGWTITRLVDEDPSELEIHRGWGGNEAAHGEQYVELDGDDPNGSSVRIGQDVSLEEGAKYELTWAFAPRQNTAASENQLSVLFDNAEVATTGPQAGIGVLSQGDWILGSYEFIADDTNGEVAFRDAGAPQNDEYGTFLDNAVLCKIAEPVLGCTDSEATNYNEAATIDDQSCSYEPEPEPESESSSTGGGGGSSSPRCSLFELDNGILSWETRSGSSLLIEADGEEIFSTDDDDVVDEGSFELTESYFGYELTVSRGSRSDTCTIQDGGLGGAAPTPLVLGEQVSAVPAGAADAGAGGASPVQINYITVIGALLRRD